MANPTPRSSSDLINSADARPLTPIFEFWQHLQHIKFHERYHTAMLEAGIPQGKADEISTVVRVYIDRIAAGLESSIYSMRELVSEVDVIRRSVSTRRSTGSYFRV